MAAPIVIPVTALFQAPKLVAEIGAKSPNGEPHFWTRTRKLGKLTGA